MGYILQSKIDQKEFKVDQKVIDASLLLKNICELTQITEPIIVNCKSQSLNIFIQLINYYEAIDMDYHDTVFEQQFYRENFKTDHELIQCIQDLCILDSDFFLDSIADYILEKMKGMGWKEIQKYLEIENDYTVAERKEIDENLMEYFLSINFGSFKFPFENRNLYSLKTKFSTPMNVLLARIIHRSNEEIASSLSLINKTMKNECDRNPLKLEKFNVEWHTWDLGIDIRSSDDKFQCGFCLKAEKHDKKYFNKIKERKVIAKKIRALYHTPISSLKTVISCSSLDFCIPDQSSKVEVLFQNNQNLMYRFDVTTCPFSSVLFDFNGRINSKKEFQEIYDRLIFKDLSKKIELRAGYLFEFTEASAHYKFLKKTNASKFYKLEIHITSKKDKFLPKFKTFVENYMEDDGIVESEKEIVGIPKTRYTGYYEYTVSIIKQFLNGQILK